MSRGFVRSVLPRVFDVGGGGSMQSSQNQSPRGIRARRPRNLVGRATIFRGHVSKINFPIAKARRVPGAGDTGPNYKTREPARPQETVALAGPKTYVL